MQTTIITKTMCTTKCKTFSEHLRKCAAAAVSVFDFAAGFTPFELNYWFDYVWFTSTLRITKGKFDCAADLQFDPNSPIIHPSKSKKCKRKMVSLLFWFPICSIPTEELKALLHVLRTSWLHRFMCVSGNGSLSESPYQRCHPRLCRRSPPSLLSFVHSRARFWRSCSRGKQRELILLPPEQLQLNSKVHDMFHMLPCHLVLIWHDLYLMLESSNCQQLSFSYRQHCNRSAAWTCCSNLKLAAQAWILDMKRINLRQHLVSIYTEPPRAAKDLDYLEYTWTKVCHQSGSLKGNVPPLFIAGPVNLVKSPSVYRLGSLILAP